jgi:hypothetical protein
MNGSMHYTLAKAKGADKQRDAEQARMIREAVESVRETVRKSQRDAGAVNDSGRVVSRVRSLLRPKTA